MTVLFAGGIVSYTAPQSPEPELSDSSYDGNRTSSRLTGGLGRLVDGQYGADNFRLDIGYGKGNFKSIIPSNSYFN